MFIKLNRRKGNPITLILGLVLMFMATQVMGANIIIVNNDAAGEGFNDPTAVTPVFGNPGTTLGQQRLNLFEAAAEKWGTMLKSTITIRVDSTMDPKSCNSTGAILGSAGPNTVHRDFTNSPLASTWYVQAVANSLSGADQSSQADISASFNSSIDFNDSCLAGTNWWYGIGAPAPAGTIDFFPVVLHEIGHGIGVLSLVDAGGTGAKFNGYDDAYMWWLYDWTAANWWSSMTDSERVASAINPEQVIFAGPVTSPLASFLTAGNQNGYPRIYTPNPYEGGSSVSHFDKTLTPDELMEPSLTANPFQNLTNGLLQDVGWDLLSQMVADYSSGTWVWTRTDGWSQITSARAQDMEDWNGNIVGDYGWGTYLWNTTSKSWALLTTADPSIIESCGDQFVASYPTGTWAWNGSWNRLTTAVANNLVCWGGKLIGNYSSGTWQWDFNTSGWRQLTAAVSTQLEACGSNLIGSYAAGTYAWNGAWSNLTSAVAADLVCWQDDLVGGFTSGTWKWDFDSSAWSQLTAARPSVLEAWGPKLAGGYDDGTWIWNGSWKQITAAVPYELESLGADLLGSYGTGTWAWNAAIWTGMTSIIPGEMEGVGQP